MFSVVGLPGGTVAAFPLPSQEVPVAFAWSWDTTPLLGNRGAGELFGHSLAMLGVMDPSGLPTLAIGDPGYGEGAGAVFLITLQHCESSACEVGLGPTPNAEYIHRVVRLSSQDGTIRRAPGGFDIPSGAIGFGTAVAAIPFPGERYSGPSLNTSQSADPAISPLQDALCLAVAAPGAGDNGEIYLLFLGLRGIVMSVAAVGFPNTTPAGPGFRPLLLRTVMDFPSAFRGWSEPSAAHDMAVRLLVPQWDAAGRVYLLLLQADVAVDGSVVAELRLEYGLVSPALGAFPMAFASPDGPPLPSAVAVSKPSIAMLEAPAQYRGGWGLSVAMGDWVWARDPETAGHLSLTDGDAQLPLLFLAAAVEGGEGFGSTVVITEVQALVRQWRGHSLRLGGYAQKAVDIVGARPLTAPLPAQAEGAVLGSALHDVEGGPSLLFAANSGGNGWSTALAQLEHPVAGEYLLVSPLTVLCSLTYGLLLLPPSLFYPSFMFPGSVQ